MMGKYQRLMDQLDVGDDLIKAAINNPRMRGRIADFCKFGQFELTPNQELAKDIMGENLIAPWEVAKHMGYLFSDAEFEKLSFIPFTEETLTTACTTHILRPGIITTNFDLRKSFDSLFREGKMGHGRPKKVSIEVSWMLIRKEPHPNTIGVGGSKRFEPLGEDNMHVTSGEVMYTMILHYLARGTWVLEKFFVECCDVDGDGHALVLGGFDEEGIKFQGYEDENSIRNIRGVASAIIPDN